MNIRIDWGCYFLALAALTTYDGQIYCEKTNAPPLEAAELSGPKTK